MTSITELKIRYLLHQIGLHNESCICIANHKDLPMNLVSLLYTPHRQFTRFTIPNATLLLMNPSNAVEELCGVPSSPLVMTSLLLGNHLTIFCRVKEQFTWSPRIVSKWSNKLAQAFGVPALSIQLEEEVQNGH